MNFSAKLVLNTLPEQSARLEALQAEFAKACNALAPVVQASRCWNRVALHHMAYKDLRAAFPMLGSQMVCNAIYSVCKAARLVYQTPASPFFVGRAGAEKTALPLLRFLPSAPVFFDRHTLSLKGSKLSIYTLDGRMKFELGLNAGQAQALGDQRVRELLLLREAGGNYVLWLQGSAAAGAEVPDGAAAELNLVHEDGGGNLLPQYLKVEGL